MSTLFRPEALAARQTQWLGSVRLTQSIGLPALAGHDANADDSGRVIPRHRFVRLDANRLAPGDPDFEDFNGLNDQGLGVWRGSDKRPRTRRHARISDTKWTNIMKILNSDICRFVGGGDNDGNAGEAEAAAFYSTYGVCERNADNTSHRCVRQDGMISYGNVWAGSGEGDGDEG